MSGGRVIRGAGPVRPLLRRAVVGIGCALLAACIPLPGGYQLTSKVVVAVEGANTLVAADGTRCVVSDKAFAEARVGVAHTCAWGRTPG